MMNTVEGTNLTEVRSLAFEKWDTRYKKNWCTKPQLVMLVNLDQITESEYKIITNLEYPNVQ